MDLNDAVATAALAPNGLVFSDSAALKVKELLAEEENPNQVLRVFVTGGGCSGFKYGFNFDEKPAEDDAVVANQGVTLVVDPMSLQYLEGAQFVIRNPNASTTCGCGSSFSV